MDVVFKAMEKLPDLSYLNETTCKVCRDYICKGKFLHSDTMDVCMNCVKLIDVTKLKNFTGYEMPIAMFKNPPIAICGSLFSMLIAKCGDVKMKAKHMRLDKTDKTIKTSEACRTIVIKFRSQNNEKIGNVENVELCTKFYPNIASGKIGGMIEYHDDKSEKMKQNKECMDAVENPVIECCPEIIHSRSINLLKRNNIKIPCLIKDEIKEIELSIKKNKLSKIEDEKMRYLNTKLMNLIREKIGKDEIKRIAFQYVFTIESGRFELGKDGGIDLILDEDLCESSLMRLSDQIVLENRFR